MMQPAQEPDQLQELKQLLQQQKPDREEIGRIAKELVVLPKECRAEIWQVILGISDRMRAAEDFDRTIDLLMGHPNERDPLLREECQVVARKLEQVLDRKVQQDLEAVLLFLCEAKSVTYCSGMADAVAPLFLLELPLHTIYDCFYKLCTLFLPQFIVAATDAHELDQDQTIEYRSEILNQLLYFHDPQMAQELAQQVSNWAQPDVTVPRAWFTTLCVGALSPRLQQSLLDAFLSFEDPDIGLFFILAVILENKTALRKSNRTKDQLISAFARENLTMERMYRICKVARDLHGLTPRSYAQLIPSRNRSSTSESCARSSFSPSPDQQKPIDMSEWKRHASTTLTGKYYWVNSVTKVSQWEHPEAEVEPFPTRLCLNISTDEVASIETGDRKKETMLPYFLIDCRAIRSSDDIFCGKVASAYTLDPSVFEDPERLEEACEALGPLSGKSTVCLIGHGVGIPPQFVDSHKMKSAVREAVRADISTINRAALFLQKTGFPYVCSLEGGYSAWHAYMRDSPTSSPSELIGHEDSKCNLCKYDRGLRDGVNPFIGQATKPTRTSFRRHSQSFVQKLAATRASIPTRRLSMSALMKVVNGSHSNQSDNDPRQSVSGSHGTETTVDYSDDDEEFEVELPSLQI